MFFSVLMRTFFMVGAFIVLSLARSCNTSHPRGCTRHKNCATFHHTSSAYTRLSQQPTLRQPQWVARAGLASPQSPVSSAHQVSASLWISPHPADSPSLQGAAGRFPESPLIRVPWTIFSRIWFHGRYEVVCYMSMHTC